LAVNSADSKLLKTLRDNGSHELTVQEELRQIGRARLMLP
jgi:hypothetical protein